MLAILDLPNTGLAVLIASVFIAGVVRGFTGFAASAVVMATATVVLAPIDLLPICLLLELVASAFLVRGSINEADQKLVLPLVGFAFVALPVGLHLTQTLPPDISTLIALTIIGVLAAMQLFRVPLPAGKGFLSVMVVGSLAGLVQGVASVGGLVHALYVLALRLPPTATRATMILGVMFSGAMGLFWQLSLGVMTWQAFLRLATVLVPFLLGLWLGRFLFTPGREQYYRPVSLGVLVVLAGAGILRQLM